MKKISILLLIFPLLMLGNMAKPYMDGLQHSVLFGGDASVKKESIVIRIVKDSLENHHYANYSIKYHIYSPQKQKLPLLFVAMGLLGEQKIKVNNQVTDIEPLNFEKKTYPFIKKNQNGTYITFDGRSEYYIYQNDLIYFSANLEKGDNIIEVKYDGGMEYNTYGFVTNYKLEYSLSPSQYWKSFGPIDVTLITDDLVEFKESNLGKEKEENNIFKWTITPQNREKIEIKLSEKTSFISKVLVALDPFGISFIALILMSFFQIKLMKSDSKKYILILGIILVPILFYVIFLLSYSLIDFSLGKDYTKHGYVFLYVVTYPIVLIFYGILMWQIHKRIKAKQLTENTKNNLQ